MDTIQQSEIDDSKIHDENSIERPNDSIRKNKMTIIMRKSQIPNDDSFISENRCDNLLTEDEFKCCYKT